MATKIDIKTHPKFKPIKVVFGAALQVGVIGIGVLADSAAMQWCGFAALLLIIVGSVLIEGMRNEGLSISEAHKRLDEIEKANK